MIIGIDGNEANISTRVGSNVYAWQILKGIWKIQNQRINNNLKFVIYLKDKPLADLPKRTPWWQYKILKPGFLWTQWRLPLELYFGKDRPDVFFTPGHYAPRFLPMPLVISIMDLAFLRYPKSFKKNDLYQLINWTKYSVNQAKHIFTISEFTKKEIIHFYQIPADQITVTYPGIESSKLIRQPVDQSSKLQLKTQILKKYNIHFQYFIYIGTLQPRKNLEKLIEAFKRLPEVQLVIAGKKGWLYQDIFKKVKELKLENQVIFTGYISEEEKDVLLRNALALVLPSLYEGFGIPVLEAMQLGCPVVISKNSSLIETAPKASINIDDPRSNDSIYQALLKMIKLGNQERKALIELGIRQAKSFSWEKTAKITLELLLKIGG